MVALIYINASIWEAETEDQEFKVILDYKANSKPV